MAAARYKELCVDASDAHALARFWGALLGWEVHPHDDGDACLRVGEQTVVWFNAVPEPVAVKNRVHLDLNAESVEAVVEAGGSVLDDSLPWTVMRDPDGQEFCVFERTGSIEHRLYEIVCDVTGHADDAHRLAQWWGAMLGADTVRDDEGFSYLEHIAGAPFESLVFTPVPEEKRTKNRIHLDVDTDDLAALVALGALPVRAKGDDGIGWDVLADPAGNEFCVFTSD